MATFGEDQVGRVLAGRYRLLAPVGSGASATVFLADDVMLRRRVAVKVLHASLARDESFLKRFRAEAQLAASLSHPHILTTHDWGEDRDTPFLVSEWLGGGSLRSLLDRGRRITPSQALLVGLETCRGLDYAHRRGLVHRDIKPANLLFGDDGRLRIADFGLARAIADAAWTEPAGVVLGTARYASPEQAKGQPVDGHSDVYSLALSLVEAVTGTVPFAADTTVATLMNRIDKLMPVSADLGPLAPVLERAGRPDPAERYDAAGFGRALVQAAERLPRPEPLPLAPSRPLIPVDRTLLGPGTGEVVRTGPRPAGRPVDPTIAAAAAAGAAATGRAVTTAAPPVAPGRRPSADPGLTRQQARTAPPPDPTLTVPATRTAQQPAQPPAGPPPGRSGGNGGSGRGGRSGRRRALPLALALLAVLAVVGGALAALVWQRTKVPSFPVPPLVGLEQGRALNLIAPNGWDVQVVTERNDTQAAGIVFRQSPESGRLEEGDAFVLYVSEGPTLSTIPEISGRTLAEVTASLEALKLTVNVAEERFDETIPAGTVMSWTVAGQSLPVGSEVLKGTVVDVVVSKGPAPRVIPETVNRPYDEVAAELTANRLVPNRLEDQFSDTVEAGRIIATDPPAGTEVARDTTVNIVVSKGPDVVTVPPLAGLTLDAATQALTAAGLAPGQAAGPVTGTVLASDPASGQVVRRGTTVNLLLT